jgi:flagellar biosynthesis regulator FlaF
MSTIAIDEAYQKSVEAELSECDIRIRELKDRVERMLTNAEVVHYRKIEALRSRERAIRDKLQNLAGPNNHAAQELRADIQNDLERLKRSIEKALEEYA